VATGPNVAEASQPSAGGVIRQIDFLLIGGGPAAATATWALRLEGAAGSIRIFSAEKLAPQPRR
jgi:hypothetical protein